ncbi:MAG: M48 family metallopeptidase [Proteobacteria bacterium]|nr:M48 family metallopeptidase [Pseudomonadota bacterium]
MAADLSDLQAARDRVLREELLTDWGVTHALKKIEERSSGFGLRTRRSLLTGALRLTRAMAPDAHDALAACRERLGYTRPVELYVRPAADMNAFCTRSVSGPIIIGVTSRLLETFSGAELRFVVGHELGHALFDHFQIPMPITATLEDVGGRFVTRPVQLKLYLWCRAAEVSADRAGVACAGDVEPAARALFKIASGLGTGTIHPDLDAFTSQLDALLASPAACADARDEEDVLDCFDTHPYSPLRVRALLAYGKSAAFQRAIGLPAVGATSDELERVVERDLAVMEPTYLEDPSDESIAMRRLLYCAGTVVAAANGELHPSELRALRALLGAKHVDLPTKPEDLEAVKRELADKLVVGRTWPLLARAQLVQHATIVAAADGVVQASELAVLFDVAEALGIDPAVIDQTLAGAAAPMD